MAAKDRLNPKPDNNSDSNLSLQVRPVIKMGAPKIDIPEIKIPEIKIPASDLKPIAEALNALATGFNQALSGIAQAMAKHDQRLVDVTAENQRLLRAIAEKDAPAPVVRMAPRPRAFDVELVREDGETVGMRIEAESLQ